MSTLLVELAEKGKKNLGWRNVGWSEDTASHGENDKVLYWLTILSVTEETPIHGMIYVCTRVVF